MIALLSTGCGGKQTPQKEQVTIRIGSLKGPTSMGILNLMEKAGKGETRDAYSFQMATGADELLPLMVKGELDICLVPANVGALLYHKTEGQVSVIDINTLGVLYMVTGEEEIRDVQDLKGRTIYLTGKGTTPEASLRYLLEKNGLEDACTLEFKSEATEVVALLKENEKAVGLLPQPFVASALIQNPELRVVLDMNEQWMKIQKETVSGTGQEEGMVTGITLVRNAFLEQHPEAVTEFLKEHRESVDGINADPKKGAVLAVEAGIVGKEVIAEQAIPKCNLTCIVGEEMKAALKPYLKVLTEFDEKITGGEPDEEFYYIP